MNNGQLASGRAFTNSNCIVQGSFSKPDIVLDTVRMSDTVKDGVIVVDSKHIKGRVAVLDNTLIVGAVVDGTGETGIGAVYKLLLVPSGRFTFRQALPSEQWHLQQDLNMSAAELKNSLAGPSSIGLSRPSDDSLTGLKPVVESPSSAPVSHYRQTASGEFTVDCNQLLEAVERKQTDSKYIVNRGRAKSQRDSTTKLRLVTNEPEAKRGDHTLTIVAVALIVVGLSVAGFFASAFKGKHESIKPTTTSEFMAAAASLDSSVTGRELSAADETKKSSMTGHVSANVSANTHPVRVFSIGEAGEKPRSSYPSAILPGGGQVNSAPPVSTSSPTFETDNGSTDTVEGLLAKNKSVETQQLSFWVNSVKARPNDPIAREHLAYTLLWQGKAMVSVQQFQALMELRKTSSQDVSRYVDALLMSNEKELAKQILTYAAAHDPADETLRAKLGSLQ